MRIYPDPDDCRAVVLSLTPAGKVRRDKVDTYRRHILDRAVAGLDEAECRQFTALVDRFPVAFEQDSTGLPRFPSHRRHASRGRRVRSVDVPDVARLEQALQVRRDRRPRPFDLVVEHVVVDRALDVTEDAQRGGASRVVGKA